MRKNALLVLAVLTLGRMCVALQFQSITPISEYLQETLPLNATGFGLLLGLYMAPGSIMSVASPVLVRRFGNVASLATAFVCMAAGQACMVMASTTGIAYLGRLIAGVGGCLVYVLTIELAAQMCDAGRRPARMAAIAASWPFGNALSLALLGALVSLGLSQVAALVPAVLALVAAGSIQWVLKESGGGTDRAGSYAQTRVAAHSTGSAPPGWKSSVKSAFMPGIAFALYNVSFILFISFTPAILVAQGYTPLAAANVAGLPMWMFIVSVPCGGMLAGRWAGKSNWLVLLGCLGGSICLVCSQLTSLKTVWYLAAGLLGGLPTGPMLAGADWAEHKLFYPILFCIFFSILLIFPPIVGMVIEFTGEIRSPIVFCVVMLMAALFFFGRSVRVANRPHTSRM